MPSRKSEPRKSDVTSARFAPVDEDLPPAPESAPPTVAAAAANVSASQDQQQQQQQSPSEKKDKGKGKEDEKDKDKDGKDAVTIEDLTLPKSIITRLAKGVLPPNTQIQGNAILAISKSATVFINYLASHANENTMNANKKTIAPADVFKALDEIEFGFLKEPLEAEFAKFNTAQTEKRTNYRQKRAAAKPDHPGDTTAQSDTHMADADTTAASFAPKSDDGVDGAGGDAGGPPRTKKQRVDPSADDGEHDDAETEVEEDQHDDDDDDDEEDDAEDEEDEEEEGEGGRQGSGDETQDALEEKDGTEDKDEALDGDESD